ncbi:ferritin-like domain-containing protein [Haloarcula salinisoli]|uniref:Ferritin-like domain-containing protein n=1 Tax=Haloarcula salinisoli TaxID=2487746 RepID=A0A8J7YBE8_9EURY|nr:ferritin-like domain-containing protein [Halomicroarcula salinisoli]MBX0286080.1 ferritin-like domain-containing protein [Halomicroarcula salinisoli]MBX0302432.1 ferritin-like domain-containing protein [Halomicroarcula salinisoli]
MSLTQPIASDHQLARLLQIGIVLEEVVEARAGKHAAETDDTADADLARLLEDASAESAQHRRQLEELLAALEADTVPFEEIQTLVEAQYEADEDFDGVLYDQLCNEETAYKFYDDLIESIEASETSFSVDRTRLLETLRLIREEEAEGVEDVTELMEARL